MVEVQRTIDRVTDRSRIVELDIHGTVNKHIMALKQREAELVSKVEQIRGVNNILNIAKHIPICTIFLVDIKFA